MPTTTTEWLTLIVIVAILYFIWKQYSGDNIPPFEKKPWEELKEMHGTRRSREFEKYCASWLEKEGYTAQLTKHSRDGGIDILVKKDGEIIGIAECKAHAKPVGRRAVADLHSTVHRKKYKKGWFFSLYGFTVDANDSFSKGRKIDLIDGKKLIE